MSESLSPTNVFKRFAQRIGSYAEGSDRNVRVETDLQVIDKKRQEWWGREKVAKAWSKESGGIPKEIRTDVKNYIARCGFYESVNEAGTVLDLAVGANSYIDRTLMPESAQVIATDYSRSMLQELRRKSSEKFTGFANSDARNLPFASNSVDRILSSFMMRYLSQEEQVKAILEMARVAKKGSIILIIDYNSVDYDIKDIPIQASYFDPNKIGLNIRAPGHQKTLHDMDKSLEFIATNLGITESDSLSQILSLKINVI